MQRRVRRRSGLDDEQASDDRRTEEAEAEEDQTPAYLMSTNTSFERHIKDVMQATLRPDIDRLRQAASLKHHIAALHVTRQISSVYLQSGTDKLREHELELIPIDCRVWPSQVKSVMLAQRSTTAASSETNAENDQQAYEDLVHQRLGQRNDKIRVYETQLDEIKTTSSGWSSKLEEAIDAFVQQHGLRPLHMKRDLKIALIKHENDATILERRYAQENPTPYQV